MKRHTSAMVERAVLGDGNHRDGGEAVSMRRVDRGVVACDVEEVARDGGDGGREGRRGEEEEDPSHLSRHP